MPTSRLVGVLSQAAAADVAMVRAQSRGVTDTGLSTTTTADPGTGGTTLAITAYPAKWPAAGSFRIRVDSETMLVTAGHSTTSLTVTRAYEGTTAAAHTVGAVVAAVGEVQFVIPVSERVRSYKGMATSFRILGRAATTQNLFSIYNTSGSAVLVAVSRLSIQMDATAVLVAVAKSIKTTRQTTAPTNGTALTKVPFDSSQASSANVEVRNDASADGTNSATTLTATPSANIAWSQLVMRMHTLVGQVLMDDESCIPGLCADDPVILRANEGLLVAVVAAATTSNPATDHHIVNCVWEEFTLP